MIRVTYRGYEDWHLERPETVKVGKHDLGIGQTAEVTAAELAKALAADKLALFDVETVGTKDAALADGKIARELERRGVSVHANLGGSKRPRGHARWADFEKEEAE